MVKKLLKTELFFFFSKQKSSVSISKDPHRLGITDESRQTLPPHCVTPTDQKVTRVTHPLEVDHHSTKQNCCAF